MKCEGFHIKGYEGYLKSQAPLLDVILKLSNRGTPRNLRDKLVMLLNNKRRYFCGVCLLKKREAPGDQP